jgi:hypothetical protein
MSAMFHCTARVASSTTSILTAPDFERLPEYRARGSLRRTEKLLASASLEKERLVPTVRSRREPERH